MPVIGIEIPTNFPTMCKLPTKKGVLNHQLVL